MFTLEKLADKEAVKAAWIEALESGKYRQVRRTLSEQGSGEIPDGFCCIGVLGCVVNEQDSFQGAWGYNRTLQERQALAAQMGDKDVSTTYSGYVLLEHLWPKLAHGLRLQQLNDKLAWSFPEIAKWLRKNL